MSGYLPPLTAAYLGSLADSYVAARGNNGVAVIVNAIYNNILSAARTGNKSLTISLSQYDSTYIPTAYTAIKALLTPLSAFEYIQDPLSTNDYTLIMRWT